MGEVWKVACSPVSSRALREQMQEYHLYERCPVKPVEPRSDAKKDCKKRTIVVEDIDSFADPPLLVLTDTLSSSPVVFSFAPQLWPHWRAWTCFVELVMHVMRGCRSFRLLRRCARCCRYCSKNDKMPSVCRVRHSRRAVHAGTDGRRCAHMSPKD